MGKWRLIPSEQTFAPQQELGIIPANTLLSRHDPDVPNWAGLSAEEKCLYAQMMEVFAGYLKKSITLPVNRERNLAASDQIGIPKDFNHYPWGWTHAGNTPLRRWKRET